MEVSVQNNSRPKKLYLKTEKGQYAMKEGDIRQNIHLLNDKIAEEVESQLKLMTKEQLQRVGEHLLNDYDFPMGICTLCSGQSHLVPQNEWGSPKGSYVYSMCSIGSSECPSCGEPDTFEVHKSSGHSATKPTVYKCRECGHKVKGITTG